MKAFWTVWGVAAFIGIAFWVTVILVAAHFIAKVW